MAFSRRAEGKIVDRFRFRIGKKEYDLPVRLIKKTTQKDGRYDPFKTTTEGAEFGIAIPNGKDFRGTDIEVLRAAAKAELGEKHAIAWEDYYLIAVKEQRDRYYHSCDGGDGMEFYWKTIKVGKTPEGKTVHKEDRYSDTDAIRDGLPKTGEHRGSVFSLVKATPETELALKEFEQRMELMRKSVEKFLGPKHVKKTLSKAAELARMLPAPKKRGKKHG